MARSTPGAIFHAAVTQARCICFPLPLNAAVLLTSFVLTTDVLAPQDVFFIKLVQLLLGKLGNEEMEEDVKEALQVAKSAVSAYVSTTPAVPATDAAAANATEAEAEAAQPKAGTALASAQVPWTPELQALRKVGWQLLCLMSSWWLDRTTAAFISLDAASMLWSANSSA